MHTCQIIILNMGKSTFVIILLYGNARNTSSEQKICTRTHICIPDKNLVSFINHEKTTMIDKIYKYAQSDKIVEMQLYC